MAKINVSEGIRGQEKYFHLKIHKTSSNTTNYREFHQLTYIPSLTHTDHRIVRPYNSIGNGAFFS